MQAVITDQSAAPPDPVDNELVQRLQGDQELWDLPRLAGELQLKLNTVNIMRRNSLNYIEAGKPIPLTQDALPAPDQEFSKKPLWYAGTIRTWAMQVGRMSPDGTPQRLRAPRKSRTTSPSTSPATGEAKPTAAKAKPKATGTGRGRPGKRG